SHAGHDGLLMDIETGYPAVHYLHAVSSIPAPPGWEPPTKRNLTSALPGVAALGTSGGLRGSAGPTRNRALRLQGASTSIRRQHHHSPAAGLPAGFIQGGSAVGRWKTRNDHHSACHCEEAKQSRRGYQGTLPLGRRERDQTAYTVPQ